MNRYWVGVGVVLALTVGGCAGADDGSETEVAIESTQQGIGLGNTHVVPWVRNASGVAQNTRCPQGQFLRGMASTGIVCETGGQWAGEPDVLRNPTITATSKIASCSIAGNLIAVGVIPATNGLICKKLNNMLTGWSPTAADTTQFAQLSAASHQLDYWSADDIGICKKRLGTGGAIMEWSEKRLPSNGPWYSFYTCAL